jgi:hypothetical protein
MTRSLAVTLGVVGLLLAAGTSEAKPRVAVVAFDGDDNGALQEVVTDLLDGDYTVSGSKSVNRTLDKLGLDANLSDKDLKKLANELEVDAILRGDLQQKGTRKLLHVKVYLNGKKVRGFKVEFASVKSEKFKTALKDKIDEKLAGSESTKKKKVEESAEAASDEEDPIGGKKTKKSAKAEKAEKAAAEKAEKTAKKSKTASDEDSGETTDEAAALKTAEDKPEGEQEADEDEDKPKKTVASADVDDEDVGGVEKSVTIERSSGGRAANRVAVRAEVGPSLSSRSLAFKSRAFEQAPKPYKNPGVGGMRVAGEIYPLAFGNPHSFLSGLGFAAHYDKTLKLELQSTAQPGTKFPVDQKHWSVGMRFRVGLGHSAKAPTVTLVGDYFHRKFAVDRTALMAGNIIDLPNVLYQGFDAGLEFRIPIIKQAALLLGGQAIFVRNTGDIQQLNSYGRAKVTAGQGMAGIDIVIANRVGLRITGELSQYGYDFTYNGELTYNRDLDPATKDVGGAADRYYGGAATLGVLY